MTDKQNSTPDTATANPPPQPVMPTPPMIDLSTREWNSLNALMQGPSGISTNNPLLPLDREVRAVAGALVHCQVGQLCAEDIASPTDIKLTQSFDLAGADGALTAKFAKVTATLKF